MNIRTIVILAILSFVVVFLLDKKWYRIESVCFEDDEVSNVVVKNGIISSSRFSISLGKSGKGYSLKKLNGKVVLVIPSGAVKIFENLSYYEKNRLNPAE